MRCQATSVMILVMALTLVAVADEHLPESISFNEHIRPIMSNTCFVCHGPDESHNESGFRIDSFDSATAVLPSDENRVGIAPGRPLASEVYLRVTGRSAHGDQMPPADFRHSLTERDRQLLRRWIEQGAEYEQHWAYTPIRRPNLPGAKKDKWVANPIDAFVLERMRKFGLEPSPAADRRALLRRVSLDLVGLPPTIEELNAFLDDESADAYVRVVERLLASPHYGERMASFWLDLVRFADTVGFHGDQNQRIFSYRDYVINAFNDNMPFDQFTREQLAGDLLPDPTDDQLVATGFLRLNMMTREGGAQPGEYLAKYRADRVRALGTVWLGATLGCCECHNHKYDPYLARDFYSFGAFFDDLRQWGVYHDYAYTPNPDLRGFSNDYPFPPEIRIDSASLRAELEYEHSLRDRLLFEELGGKALDGKDYAIWSERCRQLLDRWPSGWVPLNIQHATTSADTTAEVLDDGSVLFVGTPNNQLEIITIIGCVPQPMMASSLRVQVLPDGEHDGYVGRADDGQFEIDSFEVLVDHDSDAKQPPATRPNSVRFVRIELPGERRILSLAEVEVFTDVPEQGLVNVAPSGTALQSSDYKASNGQKLVASLAIDGSSAGDALKDQSTTHTKEEQDPWWELDLAKPTRVASIKIWNRTDGGLGQRLNGARLVLLGEDRVVLHTISLAMPEPATELTFEDEFEIPTERRLDLAWAQADLRAPYQYRSGRPPTTIDKRWRSGPSRWQLPDDEAQKPHTAVLHLEEPVTLESETKLVVRLKSSDVGRVRISTTPFGHAMAGWDAADERLRSSIAADDAHRTSKQMQTLVSAYHRSTVPWKDQSASSKHLRDRILELRSAWAMSLVAQPLPTDQIPVSRVLPRGNWQDETGELAPPGFPGFLGTSGSTGERDNRQFLDDDKGPSRLSRLDLVDWVSSRDNPLTSRHFVNRTWKQFFGTGLSAKIDDLGNQGEWPSHPLLMDWLAAEFMESGWDVKHLVRLIVTSSVYRQTAAVRDDLQSVDPYNRLLSQHSPRRLEAEIVRDNALAISGLLIKDFVGGRSVFPYQPAGHYRNLQFPNRTYVADQTWRQYRRGLYMHWQRTFLHPMLVNFDAPNRDECTAERPLSNSPQQALTLLNDPTFFEAALAFAATLLDDASSKKGDINAWIETAYQRALSRAPSPSESAGLVSLYQRQLEHYARDLDDAKQATSVGLTRLDDRDDVAELAALTQVCRVILNLHETITRY